MKSRAQVRRFLDLLAKNVRRGGDSVDTNGPIKWY